MKEYCCLYMIFLNDNEGFKKNLEEARAISTAVKRPPCSDSDASKSRCKSYAVLMCLPSVIMSFMKTFCIFY